MIINTIPKPANTPPSGNNIITLKLTIHEADWTHGVHPYESNLYYDFQNANIGKNDTIMVLPSDNPLDCDAESRTTDENLDWFKSLGIGHSKVTYDDTTIEDGIITIFGYDPNGGQGGWIPPVLLQIVIIKNS